MDFDTYKEFTSETAVYPQASDQLADVPAVAMAEYAAFAYVVMALNGEAGELAEHVKKCARDDHFQFTPERKEAMRKELGDVLYYVARLAFHLHVSLDDVAAENMQKLRDRKARNVLQGSGDER